MCCFYEANTIRINKTNFIKEPTQPIDVDLIHKNHAGERCLTCNGTGYLLCIDCEEGRVPFLGGLQECGRCRGTGFRVCSCCKGRGIG